jgi:hypothetical protein
VHSTLYRRVQARGEGEQGRAEAGGVDTQAQPPPPLMSRKQWEREQFKAEKAKRAKEKLSNLHVERRIYNKQGDW